VDLVAEAVHLCERRASRYRVQTRVDTQDTRVRGSRYSTVQVLSHLLQNAFDALEEAERQGTSASELWVEIRIRHEGDRVSIDVIDGGPGLPEHILANLFQPFLTTKNGARGTGLGLTLSLEYMRRQGGTLDGRNVPGAGACFTLTLPAGDDQPA
jgi:C4-dicarboxylate-specific signal transduction histidine kinase